MMSLRTGLEARQVSTALVFAITLLAGVKAVADELIMKDGSRLLGKVIREDGGVVDFKTSYAGVIKVKWQEISEVITDEPITVLLKNAETRDTKNVKNTAAGLVLSTDAGETTETIKLDEVAYVNPEPWRLGKVWSWKGNANIDLNYERGNTDDDEYTGDGSMTFRRTADRIIFSGDYDREKSNDVLTDDNWRLNGRYDHFVNEKFYYGANLALEHDRFGDLRLRAVTGPLVGYELYESTAMNLDVAAGPMYVNEDFYDTTDRDYLAVGWLLNFDRFLIPDRVQFYHRHRGLLEPGDVGNLVFDAWTGFRFPLYAGIVASTEVLVEYDGGAREDVDKTDTTYHVKLGYQW
jgi:putative salt-induced outer membrane protein YdiY